MFCGKCGEEVAQGTEFCPKCGEKISATTTGETEQITYVDKNKKRNTRIGIIAVGLVVLIVVVLVIRIAFHGRGYEEVIDQAMKVMETLTEESMADFLELFPDEQVEKVIEKEKAENREELVQKMADECETARKNLEEVEDLSYKIVGEKVFSEKEMEELKDDFEDIDVKLDKEIKEAKSVVVEVTMVGKNGKEDKEEFTYNVMKLGKNWYMAQKKIY